jgi:hypothetical protein
MPSFLLKCHAPGAGAPPAAFFILSRGRNTGRPAFHPNPNCFVFTCPPQYLDSFFWLVYSLWLSRRFESILHGSVIPLARVGDMRRLITDHSPALNEIKPIAGKLQQLASLETRNKKQLQLIGHTRTAILQKAVPVNH